MDAETPIDSQRRFGGVARLYGEAGLQRLAAAHVCVIGIGGVGCWAAEALARSAVGEITLIDLDHVAESNVNRQLQALEGTFGRAKVAAMAERIMAINPACQVHQREAFVEPDTLQQLLPVAGYDCVIDCIDGYRNKAALIDHCIRSGLPLISVGGAGGKCDPLKIRRADLVRSRDDPLLAKTRRLLRRSYGYPKNSTRRFRVQCVFSEEIVRPPVAGAMCDDNPVTGLNCAGFGSAMTVTASFGLVASAWVIERLVQAQGAMARKAASSSSP